MRSLKKVCDAGITRRASHLNVPVGLRPSALIAPPTAPQIIQSVPMASIHQMQMSNNLTFFHDVLGGCERLLRAPIPVSYTRHTARFLFAWLTLLPFALWDTCHWGVVPVCTGIAAVLCGIEEIGVQCEEPFG